MLVFFLVLIAAVLGLLRVFEAVKQEDERFEQAYNHVFAKKESES
jgi:hypothetical protein